MKKVIKIGAIFCLSIVLGLALVACGDSSSTEYDVVKKTKSENFALLNQTAKHNQIVMIGDSIVELYPSYELFTDFPSADNPLVVYNRGISGDTSDRMLERLQSNALNIQPEVLSILIGTNDFNRLTKEETLSNVRAAITAAKDAGVQKIILQSIYPVHKSINSSMVGGRNDNIISEYNEAYKAICTQTGAIYADVASVLKDDNGKFKADFTYDGLHPNAKGYVEITKYLKSYLTPNA